MSAVPEKSSLSNEETPAATPAASVPSTPDILVDAANVKMYFPVMGGLLRRQIGNVYAVDDVSLQIYRVSHHGRSEGLHRERLRGRRCKPSDLPW